MNPKLNIGKSHSLIQGLFRPRGQDEEMIVNVPWPICHDLLYGVSFFNVELVQTHTQFGDTKIIAA